MKQNIYGFTITKLKQITKELDLPGFAATQIFEWMYQKKVFQFAEMTNLSKKAQEKLENEYCIELNSSHSVQASIDGTKKYLYHTQTAKFIEAAYIPETDRATLCVSSQIGCKMGCLFCMTGKQGFQGNLTAGEILNQIQSLPEFDKLTNIVYMGMGEPMDNLDAVLDSIEIMTSAKGFNWSPKKITVSTIGIIPAMKSFLSHTNAHLALSLHSPFDSERQELMPIQSVYKISDVIHELKKWDFSNARRVSIEYIMFKGVNDTPRHANELVRLLNNLKCRINLIRFHAIPNSPLEGSPETTMIDFQNKLKAKGLTVTIRTSRGEDIFAACGMLSTKALLKQDTNIDF